MPTSYLKRKRPRIRRAGAKRGDEALLESPMRMVGFGAMQHSDRCSGQALLDAAQLDGSSAAQRDVCLAPLEATQLVVAQLDGSSGQAPFDTMQLNGPPCHASVNAALRNGEAKLESSASQALLSVT